MNNFIIYILSLIVAGLINLALRLKALKLLKNEFVVFKFRILLNLRFPTKEYFMGNGWSYWLVHMILGYIEIFIFIVGYFIFIQK